MSRVREEVHSAAWAERRNEEGNDKHSENVQTGERETDYEPIDDVKRVTASCARESRFRTTWPSPDLPKKNKETWRLYP